MKSYKTDEHTIIQGDGLEALKSLAPNSIDLVFVDPPYNIGKDFDGLLDKREQDEYLAWCYQWIDECYRVLKESGAVYLMNSTQNMPYMDIYCRKKFEILSRIAWYYDSSGVQARKYYGSMYEPILFMVKDAKKYTFNHKDIMVEAKTGSKRKLIDYRKNPPQPYNTKKVPGNVWEFSRVRFKMDEYESHPSQKPESLLERVILASSNPGDVVLDPFSGSFTTGAVAKKLRRKSISIDSNELYVKIGLRRLGIPSHYSEEELQKEKNRKTKNRSKKDHIEQLEVKQNILL